MSEHGPEKIPLQDRVDPYSPEREESLEIARRKKEKLLSPEFSEYAVRFMNLAEYEHMMESGEIPSREAVVQRGSSFADHMKYVVATGPRWENEAKNLTDWRMGTENIADHSGVMRLLGATAKEVAATPDMTTDERRVATLRKFREKLLRGPFKIFREARRWAEDLKMVARVPAAKQEAEEYAKVYGEEKLRTLCDFMNNETYLDDGKKVHDIISIISFAPTAGAHESTRKYHVMTIFDKSALSGRRSWQGIASWEHLRQLAEEDYDPQEAVLGTVAIIPDGDLLNELIDKSSKAGKLAHVILNHKGKVIYPR